MACTHTITISKSYLPYDLLKLLVLLRVLHYVNCMVKYQEVQEISYAQ